MEQLTNSSGRWRRLWPYVKGGPSPAQDYAGGHRVASGEVLLVTLGAGRTTMVIGDAVNLAARLRNG